MTTDLPTPLLDSIAQNGNYHGKNWIHCADGFKVSVIAHWAAYCTPRPDFDAPSDHVGPYITVEVGFPSQRPQPWARWSEYAEDDDDPTNTVYGYVPVEVVRDLIAAHGGEAR